MRNFGNFARTKIKTKIIDINFTGDSSLSEHCSDVVMMDCSMAIHDDEGVHFVELNVPSVLYDRLILSDPGDQILSIRERLRETFRSSS